MPKIHVIDSEGEEHTVEGQVGLSLMESLRDLDNGVLAPVSYTHLTLPTILLV